MEPVMEGTTATLAARSPAAPRPEPPAASHALRWAIAWTVGFGAVFVARASTTVDGRRTFTMFDDALVSARYAHELATGHGLVWNAGQPGVEGYTNFLWTLWMAALHAAGVPLQLMGLFVSATGLVLIVANLVVIRAVCRRLAPDRPAVEIVALLLTATCYPLLFWTLRGMEVGLVALVLSTATLSVLRAVDGRRGARTVTAVAIAAGVLTRTDVAVPLVAIVAAAMLVAPRDRRMRIAVPLAATLAVVVVGHTLLRLRWYGDALPNTYDLKLGGIPLGERLQRGVAVALLLGLVEVGLPLVLAAWAFVRPPLSSRREMLLPAVAFASCVAYTVYVGGDAWEWMRIADRSVAPALPLLFVLTALGADRLFHGAMSTLTARLSVVAIAAVVVTVVAAVDPFPHDLLQFASRSTNIFVGPLVVSAAIIAALATWLRQGPTLTASLRDRIVVTGVAVAIALATSGAGFAGWIDSGGDHVHDDQSMAAIAAAVRDSTTSDTTVAVTWAGSVPYFSGRPAVDLLGKSDRAVARSAPHDIPFQPGHVKWDYAYSIGVLRPDLVVGLWMPTAGDEAALAAWGYDRVVGEVWVRRDAGGIDVAGLRERLDGLHAPTVG